MPAERYSCPVAIVTLTSDFGTADGYVGAMKGVVLARAPRAMLVDITHDIPRHDVPAAAFALAQAAPHFPPGAIHVAVVDPDVGGDRRAVVVDAGEQLFVGPDNGVFSLVAPAPRAVFEIRARAFRRDSVSNTFHGRDLFAAAAGALARGAPPWAAGPAVSLSPAVAVRGWTSTPGRVEGEVIHVDVFGNLITNLPASALPPEPQVCVAGRVLSGVGRSYSSVARGQLVAYIGSAETLEIGVREGSAAGRLGVGRGAVVHVLARGQGPAPGRAGVAP
jgi:hypothetical protein